MSPTPEPSETSADATDTDWQAKPLISEPAPAKINLYLHVTDKYPSGYHELDSLVVFTRLGDTVEISPGAKGSGIRLTCDGPFAGNLGMNEDNLVARAATMLAEQSGRIDEGLEIKLTKRLPVASGIGGGSADAAATIRGLANLWQLGGNPAMLFEVALELGADVPMCLTSRARGVCRVGGIGDEIFPSPALPYIHLVLVNPGVAQSTPAVFAARDRGFSDAAPIEEPGADAAALAEQLAGRRNDLTKAAVSLSPAIANVLSALSGMPDCLLARMSGSGATCFGIFADPGEAETAAGLLRERHPDWWVRATALMQSFIET